MGTELDFEDIVGGMGIRMLKPKVVNRISRSGHNFLGTISGVLLGTVVARELQNGDLDGDIRRALKDFPFPEHSKMVLDKYFVEGGIKKGTQYKKVPKFTINPPKLLKSLTICANYAYVWLAKEGHDFPVSVNYLEKVSMPHIYAITGAMLAPKGLDYITMGAGIPFGIPAVINAVSEWRTVSYPIPVIGKDNKTWSYIMSFNPKEFLGEKPYEIKKPGFIPIISSYSLAFILDHKLPKGSIQAFAIERVNEEFKPISGGHNANPRKGDIYSKEDEIDYSRIAKLGIPFIVGGGATSPQEREAIKKLGATGIQAGSIFALSEQSEMEPELRRILRKLGFNGQLKVRTDTRFSSTTYSFKIAPAPGTLSEKEVYDARVRKCELGGLVVLYEKDDGSIGYRCSAEPIEDYKSKGGNPEECEGRGCLCEALFAICGIGSPGEPPIVTMGDDLSFLQHLMQDENDTYSFEDAINYILNIF